jgi:hypothetical protein
MKYQSTRKLNICKLTEQTLWSWALFEMLPVVQLFKNFRSFHGTLNFISVLIWCLYWPLSWGRSIQSILSKIHFNIIHPPMSLSFQAVYEHRNTILVQYSSLEQQNRNICKRYEYLSTTRVHCTCADSLQPQAMLVTKFGFQDVIQNIPSVQCCHLLKYSTV